LPELWEQNNSQYRRLIELQKHDRMNNTELALDFVKKYNKRRENMVSEELAVFTTLCDIANEKDKMLLDLIEGLDSKSVAKEIGGLCEDCLSKNCEWKDIACQGIGMYRGALEMAKWITNTLSEKSRSSIDGSKYDD